MQKAKFESHMKMQIGNFLSEFGYVPEQDMNEFRARREFGMDRVVYNFWMAGKEYSFFCVIYRRFDAIEQLLWGGFGELLGDTMAEPQLHRTLNFNPTKIQEKRYDYFNDSPFYVFKVDRTEQGAETLLGNLIKDFNIYVFPVLAKYDNIIELDKFLHDDMAGLASNPLEYYRSKAYLFDYSQLFLKSLIIAKMANNPDYNIIYEANRKRLLPFIGQGEEANDNLFKSLEKLNEQLSAMKTN